MLDPEMSFEAYAAKKKIGLAAWQRARPTEVARVQERFEQMGAVSFDHTHKFLINDWRRDFPLAAAVPPAPVDPE